MMSTSPFGARLRAMREARGWTQGYETPPTPEGKLDVICREAAFYRRGPALITLVAQQERPAEHWRALRMFMTWQNGAEQVASLHLLTRGDLEELHPHRTGLLRPVVSEPGRGFLAIVIEDDADFIVFHPQLTILTEKGQAPRLDFLVSLSNGGHPRRVDLEIDGPGTRRSGTGTRIVRRRSACRWCACRSRTSTAPTSPNG